jgi:ribosomal protein S4
MGFSSSVLESAKIVKKGFVYVNNTLILKRSYSLDSGDKIQIILKKKR